MWAVEGEEVGVGRRAGGEDEGMVGDCLSPWSVRQRVVGRALLCAACGAELGVSLLCCAAQKLDLDRSSRVVPCRSPALDDGIWEAFVALKTRLDRDEEVVLLDETERYEGPWCANVPVDVC